MLNGQHLRPDTPLTVEPASFTQKGTEYKPREAKRLDKVEQMLLKQRQKQDQAWDDQELTVKDGLKIVIIENFYTREELAESPDTESLLEEIQAQLLEEVESKIGTVSRCELYHENPICKLKFQTPLDAEKCIELMNNRWFDGRQLQAYFWDGVTDYRVES